ncbi:hypothetical protein BDZ89DRAFT_1066582 [Hymenopellis radicata]|nr:hypothetical protein BDZ89DRAFT_1066582 [Hymenopellis radicata]
MPCIAWLCYARVRGYFGFVGDGRFNWPFPVAFEIIPVLAFMVLPLERMSPRILFSSQATGPAALHPQTMQPDSVSGTAS